MYLCHYRSASVVLFSCFGKPRDRVKEPCASASMSSTRLFCRASPMLRLAVVVVLPTPPFWFVTAITLQFAIWVFLLCINLAACGAADGYVIGQISNFQLKINCGKSSDFRLFLKQPVEKCRFACPQAVETYLTTILIQLTLIQKQLHTDLQFVST